MVGGLIGLSILNPLSLVLGIFMGRRVLREEKQRQLASRREQAHQSVSRYLEEVTFRVSKDVQDAAAADPPGRCGRHSRRAPVRSRGRSRTRYGRPSRRGSRRLIPSRSTPSSPRCSSSQRASKPPATPERAGRNRQRQRIPPPGGGIGANRNGATAKWRQSELGPQGNWRESALRGRNRRQSELGGHVRFDQDGPSVASYGPHHDRSLRCHRARRRRHGPLARLLPPPRSRGATRR